MTPDVTASELLPSASPAGFTVSPERRDDIGYVRLNGELYALRFVGTQIDPLTEAQKYCKERVRQAEQTAQTAVVRAASEEWRTQINHLAAKRQRGSFTIPSEFQRLPVRVNPSGKVMEVRPIVVHPHEVIGPPQYFDEYHVNRDTAQWRAVAGEASVSVKIKSSLYLPGLVGISVPEKKIYIYDVKTPHTMGGAYLCIGSSRFEDYISLNVLEMSRQISVINLFSLAGRAFVYGGTTVPLTQIITNETVIEVKPIERDSAWTTRAS